MSDESCRAQSTFEPDVREAMSRPNRSEAEVFADLERLCRSPGYGRVIARMCLLDSMISYADEVAASDMLKLYDSSKLFGTK